MRMIHCERCKCEREFKQFRVRKIPGQEWARRRWFRCTQCENVVRMRDLVESSTSSR